MNWWLPLHAESTARRGWSWGYEEWWEGKESGAMRWMTLCVSEWQTERRTDRERERARGGESEARSSPWEIFKSSGRDKSVRVITHPVCPLWFMEWDRNWLTKRRESPPPHTHTGLSYCCTQSKLLTEHFGPAQLPNKRPVVSLSLAPLFLSPSSVSMACPSI